MSMVKIGHDAAEVEVWIWAGDITAMQGYPSVNRAGIIERDEDGRAKIGETRVILSSGAIVTVMGSPQGVLKAIFDATHPRTIRPTNDGGIAPGYAVGPKMDDGRPVL